MQDLKTILQKHSLRHTPQRQEIWEELNSDLRPRDVEEIFLALRKNGSKTSKASIYNTIDLLVNNNIISRLQIGNGSARFGIIQKDVSSSYLICMQCKEFIEFRADHVEEMHKKITELYNFNLNKHSHQLYGICEDCQ